MRHRNLDPDYQDYKAFNDRCVECDRHLGVGRRGNRCAACNEEIAMMKSGYHQHVCPSCGPYVCPKVTHCQDPLETPCMDCRALATAKSLRNDALDAQEADDAYEPDDPKHPRWWR